MINEIKAYVGECDNCGEIFEDDVYTIFVLESDIEERMCNNGDWYADGTDPDHKGKHYCPNCFEYHDEIDDKIVVDLSRQKLNSTQKDDSKQSPAKSYSVEELLSELSSAEYKSFGYGAVMLWKMTGVVDEGLWKCKFRNEADDWKKPKDFSGKTPQEALEKLYQYAKEKGYINAPSPLEVKEEASKENQINTGINN